MQNPTFWVSSGLVTGTGYRTGRQRVHQTMFLFSVKFLGQGKLHLDLPGLLRPATMPNRHYFITLTLNFEASLSAIMSLSNNNLPLYR